MNEIQKSVIYVFNNHKSGLRLFCCFANKNILFEFVKSVTFKSYCITSLRVRIPLNYSTIEHQLLVKIFAEFDKAWFIRTSTAS